MPETEEVEKETEKSEATKKEMDNQENVVNSAKQTSDSLLDKLKTDELKANEKKDKNKTKSKNQETEAKGAGGDTDYANILEKIAYGLLITGGIALVGLVISGLLAMIWFTPISAAVFTAFGVIAGFGLFTGVVCYLSKFVVDVVQTFARTKFKGSSPTKSKEPEIKKETPKVSNPDPPKKVQSQAQNTAPKQDHQNSLKIRSNTTKSAPQQI